MQAATEQKNHFKLARIPDDGIASDSSLKSIFPSCCPPKYIRGRMILCAKVDGKLVLPSTSAPNQLCNNAENPKEACLAVVNDILQTGGAQTLRPEDFAFPMPADTTKDPIRVTVLGGEALITVNDSHASYLQDAIGQDKLEAPVPAAKRSL